MRRLVVLTEGRHFPGYRYRVEAFAPELAERGWHVDVLSRPSGWGALGAQLSQLAGADAVLWQRRLPNWRARRQLRRSAHRLILDFDDALMARAFRWQGLWQQRRLAIRRFQQLLRTADATIVGSQQLCNLADHGQVPANLHHIPTCMDHRLYPLAQHVRGANGLQLVWTGSPLMLRWLAQAHAPLTMVSRALPKTTLKVVCREFPKLSALRIVPTPWNPDTEAVDLAQADIGIAWLPDSPHALANCGLEVLQYMAAGLPVVANSVTAHRHLIDHGRTGFLADTSSQWVEAVATLAHSPELRLSMGCAARARVAQHFSVQAWAGKLTALLDDLTLTPRRPTARAA